MPGMPGSFGRWNGPEASTTNRARMSSPRLVLTRQRLICSSQRRSCTWVEKIAESYRPKCLPMLRQCW
ncbi:hypothetical protein MAA44156_04561 [Mycobacterium avium subsp. avium]|nr:hypothetical protein MAA44156_04561 [Mycobacterium avium subsp. avium]